MKRTGLGPFTWATGHQRNRVSATKLARLLGTATGKPKGFEELAP